MSPGARSKTSKKCAQILLVIVASAVAAAAAQAKAPDTIVFVPPTDLPALARQSGEAMFLHRTIGGRTLLYIEQDHGSRLATLDVTDPAHVRAKSSVQLDSSGPFDFFAALGSNAELIRFRQGYQVGVLDLHKENAANLKVAPAMSLQGQATPVGNDVVNTQTLNQVLDGKQVREEVTNATTGTTFLLTENGLYLIRRPAVESENRRRQEEWFLEHAGG
ncbi:MAG TPA: hypothetical protein VGE92_13590 [Steroidobacteraceae bacterium]